ncbi:hypothetical protein MPER_04590 [Moniliophthora perniciosa FA553]|nr:hypothetical protein MPER_04590 [Moniliophthora perniciosa FA553]
MTSNQNFGYGEVRVSKILVHPIKSCRGTSVQTSRYTPEGLEFDRRWAVIEADTHGVITAREVPKAKDSGCRPFSIPLRPDEAVLKTWKSLNDLSMFGVFTVDGYICQAAPESSSSSPELNLPSNTLSAYFGRPVHLVYKGSTPRSLSATVILGKKRARD